MSETTHPTTNLTLPSDREIVMTRVFEAPRRLVWEAWTNPKHLPHWMLGPSGWTMPLCEIDLRPGGAWHFVWRKEDGEEMEMRGVYQEITPPERLVNTESWGGDWPETINTVVFTEAAGQTTITTTLTYPTKELLSHAPCVVKISFTFPLMMPHRESFPIHLKTTGFLFVRIVIIGLRRSQAEVILAQLIEENYINEERFAIQFAGGKFRIKSWGRIKIQQALLQKKISQKKGERFITSRLYRNINAYNLRID
jgi:uncharacterized protein YndB with AHSA1/START domain